MKERLYLASYPLGWKRLRTMVVETGPSTWRYRYRSRDSYDSPEEAALKLAAEGFAVGKKAEDPRVANAAPAYVGKAGDTRLADYLETTDLGKYPCWEVERIS